MLTALCCSQAQFTEVTDTDLKAMDSQVSELITQVQSVTQSCRQLDAGGMHCGHIQYIRSRQTQIIHLMLFFVASLCQCQEGIYN